MRHGFTIIELMIALVISSLVGISLYQMFFQTSRSVKEMIQVIQADEPIYPLYNQLQNDITGMFAPQATVTYYLKNLADATSKNPNSQEKNEKSESAQNKGEEKKQDNTIKNVFFVETKEKGYLFLSFITTGGISQLEANGSLMPQDFMRRVAYVVEDDPNRPGTLKLSYRFSNQALGLDFIKKSDFYPSYKILEGIKDFVIEFTIFEPQSSDTKEKAKASSKVVLKAWKEEEIFEKYKALIPAYITIKGTYADEGNKVPHEFEFDFKVYSYSNYELPAKRDGKQATPEKEKAPNSGNTMNKITKFFEGALGNKNGNSSNQ